MAIAALFERWQPFQAYLAAVAIALTLILKFLYWRSIDNASSWTKLIDYPDNNFDVVKCIEGDANTYGTVYIGFRGSGFAYGKLQ